MQITDLAIPAETRAAFAHLLEKIGTAELPTPAGWRLLVLQYVRGEKSAGGILFADKTRQEDEWQGRVGLVLAVGPTCWSDTARYGARPWAKVGDVVLWPKLDNASTRIPFQGVTLAFLNDDSVVAAGIDPMKAVA